MSSNNTSTKLEVKSSKEILLDTIALLAAAITELELYSKKRTGLVKACERVYEAAEQLPD